MAARTRRCHDGVVSARLTPPAAFFEALGWRARDVRSIFRAGVKFRRAPLWMRPLALFPDPDPRAPAKARWSAVVRFEGVRKSETAHRFADGPAQ